MSEVPLERARESEGSEIDDAFRRCLSSSLLLSSLELSDTKVYKP